MEDLASYRSRIGLFAASAFKKSSVGSKPKSRTEKSFPTTKSDNKCNKNEKNQRNHPTEESSSVRKSENKSNQNEQKPQNHQTHCILGLVLFLVSAFCVLERYPMQFSSITSCMRERDQLQISSVTSCTLERPPLQFSSVTTCTLEKYPLQFSSLTCTLERPPLQFSFVTFCLQERYQLQFSSVTSCTLERPPLQFSSVTTCTLEKYPLQFSSVTSCTLERLPLQFSSVTSCLQERYPLQFSSVTSCTLEKYPLQFSSVTCTLERPPLQFSSVTTCALEKYPLQFSSVTCTLERPPLQFSSVTTCTLEKYPLQFSSVTSYLQERYQLQFLSVTSCTLERPPLQFSSVTTCLQEMYQLQFLSVTSCTLERPPLQFSSVTTSTLERPPLQLSSVTCTLERYPLQFSSVTCTLERYPLQFSSVTCTLERYPLQFSSVTCILERYPLQFSSVTCTLERPPLQFSSVTTSTLERPPLQLSSVTCTLEKYPLQFSSVTCTLERYRLQFSSVTSCTRERYPLQLTLRYRSITNGQDGCFCQSGFSYDSHISSLYKNYHNNHFEISMAGRVEQCLINHKMYAAVNHISTQLFYTKVTTATPDSEEPELGMYTAVSHTSTGLFNTNITTATPDSEEPELGMYTAVSHTSTGLFNTNITTATPDSEESELGMYTAVSRISTGLFNTNVTTATPDSEEPELGMYTAVSRTSTGLFNTNTTTATPDSEEPELGMYTAVSRISTGLFNTNTTTATPDSEEPELGMYTAVSRISTGLFNTNTTTATPDSEEPELGMYTAVSCISSGLFNTNVTTASPGSEEPELGMYTAVSRISTGLFNTNVTTTTPDSEEPELGMYTAVSRVSTGLFNTNVTTATPDSEESELGMYTAVSRTSTGLFNTNVTTATPDSEEPELGMYTAVSRISTGLFNTNTTTATPDSEEPELGMYTAVSRISTGLFNTNVTTATPGSEEPELGMYTAVSRISTGLFNTNVTTASPGSEEPELGMYTAVSRISTGLFNTNVTTATPNSEEPELGMYTAVSHVSTGLFNTNVSTATPDSEEPELGMYTAVSHVSTGLFNTNITTATPASEEPELGMCTTVSRICRGVFNRNVTSPVSNEPELYMTVGHLSTGLFNCNITSPGSEEPYSIVGSLSSCSCLLGNKGCHIYNGNPTDIPEAWLTPETLSLIKKNVEESVGYIRIKLSLSQYSDRESFSRVAATGFRVGDCYMMTAYHVFRQTIGERYRPIGPLVVKRIEKSIRPNRVNKIEMRQLEIVITTGRIMKDFAFEIGGNKINLEDLLRKLEITDLEVVNSTEPFDILVEKILIKFMKDSATNMSLLIQRLAGFIDTDKFTSKLENRWNQNCVVDFINHGQFSVDWKIEFGDEESDIIIVKLNAKAGQTFPKPMLLDENFMDHRDIHVIRYIHDDTPKIIMDQDTQEFKEDAELRQNVEAAVQWWKTKFPKVTDNFFYDCYKSCNKAHDEESGSVVLRASKSFTHGASGSPIVYSFNNTGQPIVGMIFQRGYPEFYYSAQEDSKSRFHGTQVDMKSCFFEGGTTMRKAARLLEEYNRHDLKHNVFSSLREMEIKVVNIEDLKPLLHTQIAQEFVPFAAELKNVKSEVQQLTAVTENISSEVQDVRAVTETVRSEIQQVTAVTENVRSEVQDVRAEMVTRGDLVDLLAQHGAAFALPAPGNSSDNTTASQGSKKPTDLMDKNVEIWQTVDSKCYVTKAMKYLVDKISKDHYTCVTGVPGSGKSTTIRHAALWLKNNQGFTVYPILELSEFDLYFDRNKSQVFIYDDVLGEYSINNDKLSAWKKYNETIKNCLGENTKFLTSLRIQLFEDETIKGKTYIFNENLKSINLGDAEFRLSTDEMKDMLRHYLQLKAVRHIKRLIEDIEWEEAESFVKCFPLLCKVFSDSESARVNPRLFFSDPFQALTKIFTQIQHENKRQFCGLVLCSVLELNDDYFSYIDEHELEKDKIELRNVVLKIYKQDPDKDLTDIKAALQTLDGVYITRVGNTFRLSHSIFQNIVLYLCKESSFVLKYGTQQLISDRVRLVKRYPGDNEYVLVYNSDRDVQRLADRFIQELKSDILEGAVFIAWYRCIDEDRLISCLKTQLFDNKDVSQDMIDVLCLWCVLAVCDYRYYGTQDVSDITTWCGYKLLVMLLQGGAHCNIQYRGLCAIHVAVYLGELPVIKLLVQYQADCINSVDKYNRSVLHYAVCPLFSPDSNIEITRFLLSLPNLKCLNQRDRHNRTPYWYVVHNKQVEMGGDVCVDCDVRHRQDMIDLYKQKGAILSDINQ